jgi:hypothetical protein
MGRGILLDFDLADDRTFPFFLFARCHFRPICILN